MSMRKIGAIKRMRLALAFLAALAGAPAAQAAASATITLDMANFSVVFLSGIGSFNAGALSFGGTVPSAIQFGASAAYWASGAALGANTYAATGAGVNPQASASFSGQLTLAPNAIVDVSVPYSGSFSADYAATEFATIGGALMLSGGANGHYQSGSDAVNFAAPVTLMNSSQPVSGLLDVMIRNTSGATEVLTLSGGAFAAASAPYSPVAVVPEPTSYAMMLLGLGLVASAVRLRRR